MSRIGSRVLKYKCKLEYKDKLLTLNGDKGKESILIDKDLDLKIENGSIQVIKLENTRKKHESINQDAIWGTINSLINNAIKGVETGHKLVLILRGVGVECFLKDNQLVLKIGNSHLNYVKIIEGLVIKIISKESFSVEGTDLQKVGNFASKMEKLSWRKKSQHIYKKQHGIFRKDRFDIGYYPKKEVNKKGGK